MMRRLAAAWPREYTDRQAFQDFNELFFGSPLGERVLYRIMEMCRLYASPVELIVDAGKDASRTQLSVELTFQNIGRQDIARRILDVLLDEPLATPPAQAMTEAPAPKPGESDVAS